jgi:SAM-dependent methyltransferase
MADSPTADRALFTRELVQQIIGWDIANWSKPLRYWERQVNWNSVNTCLELGCGEGGLSLWLALRGKQVVCSDLCRTKERAEPLHEKHRVHHRIVYQDIDATEIPYSDHFDLVALKSVVGGIGRDNNIAKQSQVFEEIYKALKPGGLLLFAENLVASPVHRLFRRNFVSWGTSWRYLTAAELHGFLRRFSFYDLKTTGVIGAFGRTETQRRWLSMADRFLLDRLVPASWNYIGYGIARK